MKLIMGEPGPGLIVKPGEYPDNSLSNTTDSVSKMPRYKSDISESYNRLFQIKLFDLASDPSESENVASRHPELVTEMTERLAELDRTALPPFTGPDILAGNPNLNGGIFGTGWCDKP